MKINHSNPITPGRVWPVSLTSASRRLGVTSHHLLKVLQGKRKSIRLARAYAVLVEELKGGKA